MLAEERFPMDLYGPLLEKILFPVLQAARGRPTAPLLQFLRGSEHWSLDALRDLQAGLLRRLIRHAGTRTVYYSKLLDHRGLHPDDFRSPSDLQSLPVLERDLLRGTIDVRTASEPHAVDQSGGIAAAPFAAGPSAESQHWHEATQLRAYGWAGYRMGMRALHYWGESSPPRSWLARKTLALDHKLKRDLYIDCVVRSEPALASAVRELAKWKPQVIIAYTAGAAALARFVNDHGLRTWGEIPVIACAERLWPHDRNQITAAFGPVFETYGHDGTLIGSECEVHDGLHTSMESAIVELIVREPGGRVRAARPGEVGEVAITDLHNLGCPMIRYLTGDVAVARPEARCPCGRGLAMIGPIHGRVLEPVHESRGRDVPLTPGGKRNVVTGEPAAPRLTMLA
jgi:phenylacetate-CoA ligase